MNREQFKLYPNPAKSYTNFTSNYFSGTDSTIKIYGSDGRLLQIVIPQAETMLLNIEQLGAGVYIIKQGIYSYKLIKL